MRKIYLVLCLSMISLLFSCHKDQKPGQPGAQIAPALTTDAASGITSSSATSGGAFTIDGTYPITSKGVQWDTSSAFRNNWKVAAGSGASDFPVSFTGLTPNTTFYLRAYASADSTHTWFGDTVRFTTTYIAGAYQVSTIAGTGAPGRANGDSSIATFYGPTGVAVDKDGNIFVADELNMAIRKITPSGIVSTLAFIDGKPNDVVTDTGGNVYVGESTFKVLKITPSGQVSTFAGSGQQAHQDGTGAGASFMGALTLAIDPAGNLYVGDGTSFRKITPASVVSTLPDYFKTTTCLVIAVDNSFSLFESDGHITIKVDSSGNESFLAGSAGTGNADGTGAAAAFGFLDEFRIDTAGNIYAADAMNNEIRMITQTGIVSTVAGTGVKGSLDGNSAIATFNSPVGLALDNAGNIIVADLANNKIRKITPL